jgi:hypothetical protein
MQVKAEISPFLIVSSLTINGKISLKESQGIFDYENVNEFLDFKFAVN